MTQKEAAEKVEVSLAYVIRITKGREQIMDGLGYDVELAYKRKSAK